MIKGGWVFLLNSRCEHYFIDGKSLCKKWLTFSKDYDRTIGQPQCKACLKKLESMKLKEKENGNHQSIPA